MITVSIEPHQLTAGRAAELGITLKNTGTGPCTNVVVKIDVPPGIRWLGGRERIQLDSLAGGDTFLHRLRVRPESAGEYVISSSNFSYCDPQGVSRRQLLLHGGRDSRLRSILASCRTMRGASCTVG